MVFFFELGDPLENQSTLASSSKNKRVSTRNYNIIWESDYPWLYFDSHRDGAFCKLCEKHVFTNSASFDSSGGIFITKPFKNFKKALGREGKLSKHAYSVSHIRSVEQKKLSLVASKNPV